MPPLLLSNRLYEARITSVARGRQRHAGPHPKASPSASSVHAPPTFDYPSVATLVIVTMVPVLIVDQTSVYIRRQLK